MADEPALDNKTGLLRDPRTGRVLSKLATTAARAEFEAQSFGLPAAQQRSLALEMTVEHDTEAVQNYLLPVLHLLRAHQGSAAELKQVLPLVSEMRAQSQQDVSLRDGERKRIATLADQITAFVQDQISFKMRLASTLKNVAKASTTRASSFTGHALSGASESLSHSPSLLFRLAGKALSYRPTHHAPSTFGQDFRKARAESYRNIIPESSASAAPQLAAATEKVASTAPVKIASTTTPVDKTLQSIDKTDKQILAEHKQTNAHLKASNDMASRTQEEKERADHPEGHAAVQQTVAATKKKVHSVVGSLFDGLKKVLFGGDSGGGIGLLDSLKIMGVGALAIGAAWAGWKVGDWISQMVGLGSSSEALSKLFDTQQESLSDTFQSIQRTLLDLETHGKTPAQLETEKAKADEVHRALKNGMMYDGMPIVGDGTPEMFVPDNILDAARKFNAAHAKQHDINLSASTAPALTSVPIDNAGPISQKSLPGAMIVDRLRPPAPRTTAPPAPRRTADSENARLHPLHLRRSVEQDPSKMTISDRGLKFIEKEEGFRAHPYQDSDGAWVIGYGSRKLNGQEVSILRQQNPNLRISQTEAEANLKERLERDFLPKLRGSLTRPVTQHEFDALASLLWNRGVGSVKKHTGYFGDPEFIAKFNAGTATREDWIAAHGRRLTNHDRTRIEARRGREYDFANAPMSGVEMASLQSASSAASNIIFAPTTVTHHGGGGGTIPLVTERIAPENPDATARSIRSLSGF